MYRDYFGLSEMPFSGQPGPRALFCRGRQRAVIKALRDALARAGGAVVLGAPGSGKTVTCRLLLRALPAHTDVVLVERPPRDLRELLLRILASPKFNLADREASTTELLEQLAGALARTAGRGRRALLLIDDAQDLDPDTLGALAHGLGFTRADATAPMLVLFGRPALEQALATREGRALAGRIDTRVWIETLDAAETAEYVTHRLRAAGAAPGLFTAEALRLIHRHAGGVPRRIDILCDRALLGAYFANRELVNRRTARAALRDATGRVGATGRSPLPRWCRPAAALGTAVAGTLLLTLWWARLTGFEAPPDAAPSPAAAAAEPAAAAPPARPASQPAPVADAGAAIAPLVPLHTLARELSTRRLAAERRLLARWSAPLEPAGAETLCRDVRAHGFRCLHGSGDWATIARLNRPAVLTLRDAGADPFYAVVVGMSDDAVTLDVGGTEFGYRREEIDRLWQGQYLVLWRPPLAGVEVIGHASAPPALQWLRRALEQVQGEPVAIAEPGAYDWPLTRRVMEFQRAAGLDVDGTVGPSTFIALNTALNANATPVLHGARFN